MYVLLHEIRRCGTCLLLSPSQAELSDYSCCMKASMLASLIEMLLRGAAVGSHAALQQSCNCCLRTKQLSRIRCTLYVHDGFDSMLKEAVCKSAFTDLALCYSHLCGSMTPPIHQALSFKAILGSWL